MISFALFLAPLLSTAVYAANDWTKPCFQGVCSYDLPAVDGGASGNVKIWGSPDAITDITVAAGWEILGCEKDALAQDIRLVCKTGDSTASGCDHLYQGPGAAGKLVRLPENCGQSAFARVSRAWVHEDQSIPADIAKRLIRRNGELPVVKGLALDTDFAAVDPTQAGPVSIAVQGSNVSGQNGNLTVVPPAAMRRRRSHRIASRGLFDFIGDALEKFSSFDKDVTKNLPPLDIDKSITLFDEKISCPAVGPVPAFDAGLSASAAAKMHAVVQLGMVASGSIVPPKLDEFAVYTGLTADFNGSLTLSGAATGTADSGEITLFQVGIPGLDFPGILTLGPTFKINAQAKADLGVNIDVTVALNYKINDAKLFFPQSDAHKSGGGFAPGDSPLKISISPNASVTGTVEAHVIPTIDLGLNALGGLASATVFLNLDASTALTLSANAGTTLTVVGDASPNATATDANACVNIGAGLDVNAGAQGSFFKIFNPETKINLFSKKFQLLKKCVNGAVKRATIPSRRSTRLFRSRLHPLERRAFALKCPADVAKAISVVDESVLSTNIKVL